MNAFTRTSAIKRLQMNSKLGVEQQQQQHRHGEDDDRQFYR